MKKKFLFLMMATMLGMSAWAVDDCSLNFGQITASWGLTKGDDGKTLTISQWASAGWDMFPVASTSEYSGVAIDCSSPTKIKLAVTYDQVIGKTWDDKDNYTEEFEVTASGTFSFSHSYNVTSVKFTSSEEGGGSIVLNSAKLVGIAEASVSVPASDLTLDISKLTAGWGLSVSESTITLNQWASANWAFNTGVSTTYYKGISITLSETPMFGSNIKITYANGEEQDIYYGTWGDKIEGDFTQVSNITNIAIYGNNSSTEATSLTLSDCKLVCRTASIGSACYTTFSSALPIDFSLTDGITAYIAKKSGDVIELTEVEKVPANTGVILKGAANTYPIAATNSSTDEISANELLVSDGTITGDESTIFVLANKSHGVGFYLLKSGETIPKGKAYLQIPAASLSRSIEFLGFDENGTTGIVEAFEGKPEDSIYYSLSGQRVDSPKKGLYIVKGKKVIMK